MRRKSVGESGRFLIDVHPKVDIWEREGAEQFVRELRTVDPDVTGTPIITFEAIRLMERAYLEGTVYAFVLVGPLTFAMLRRVRETRSPSCRSDSAWCGRWGSCGSST